MNGVFLLCPCWWHKECLNLFFFSFFFEVDSPLELVSSRVSQAHRRRDPGWRLAGHPLTAAPLIYEEALKNRSVA